MSITAIITNTPITAGITAGELTANVTNVAITAGVENSTTTYIYGDPSTDYIPKNVITAKGDLIVGTAASTPATLSSQSFPGYFPVVDPTEAKGIKFTNQIDGGTF